MRAVRHLFNFIAFLFCVLVVVVALAFYLGATGKNARLTKTLVAHLGEAVEGQITEHLDLDVRLRPGSRLMTGTARIHVRADEAGRRLLYFVLNGGLRVREAWEEKGDGTRIPLPFYRIWLVTVLDLQRSLDVGENVRVGLRYDGNPAAGGMGLVAGGVMERDEVILPIGEFWYPTDLQGSFMADVTVAMPSRLSLVHNGREVRRESYGDTVRVRWTTQRPVPALALVSGQYREFARAVQQRRYRVLLADGVGLDPQRILDSAAVSDALYTNLYGTDGLSSVTIFVNRDLERAFNDGGGLVGIPSNAFNRGDYGVATVAHEIAHNWWGGTVAEKWLQPASGGEWIVEGFAQFSTWLAVEAQLGEAALVRLREQDFFDPLEKPSLHELSMLDNGLHPGIRPVIYGKGAYATSVLRQIVGEDHFGAAMRELLGRFRYRQATVSDVEEVFAEIAKQDLSQFFADWIYSGAALDLALETSKGVALVGDRGMASGPSSLRLWRVPADGNPESQTVAVGSATPIGNAEYLVLDPLLETPDMYRASNVLPRRPNPRAVARSARGELMVVYGEPYPWAPATVRHLDGAGQVVNVWEFDRGLVGNPVWTADGTRMFGTEVEYGGGRHEVVLHAADGTRRIPRWTGPATATSEEVVIARDSRLLRVDGRRKSLITRRPSDFTVEAPLASPDGKLVAYAARTKDEMELRAVGIDGGGDRFLLSWLPSDVDWAWSLDGSRLFAVLPGDWDWQLWEIPLDGSQPRALVREAAAIASVDASPDGGRVAIVAAADLDYGRERREVFVIDLESTVVRRFNVDGGYAHDAAWLDGSSLVVVVSDTVTPAVPKRRELRRLMLPDGNLERFP